MAKSSSNGTGGNGDDGKGRPTRNRRNKLSTFLGELTDELRLTLGNDIYGKMTLKVAALHMKHNMKPTSVHTLKSFLGSVYVNSPRPAFLKAVIDCCFASEESRTKAKMILARTTGEYSEAFLGSPNPSKPS